MEIEDDLNDEEYVTADSPRREENSTTGPLQKLSVLVGANHLNFKIVEKKDAPPLHRTREQPDHEDTSKDSLGSSHSRPKRWQKRGALSNNYSMAYGLGSEKDTGPKTGTPEQGSYDAEFNCMFCGCSFETVDDLTDHEPACAGGETESMNIACHCGRTFINIDALDSHSKVHEIDLVPPGSANFHCRYCGKAFGTALSLATHEAVHAASLKPFRCNFCNKAFVRKADLTTHEGSHIGETPYMCSYCDKAFPNRMKLSRHEVVHTGPKPYTCQHCSRAFSNGHSLQKHERTHTGEKPFQCPICTKCFAAQSNYDVHMKLHASGRRFFCQFCGKWFRTEHQMLEHQQNCLATIHGQGHQERPLRYQCNYCEKMFHYRRDQLIHERTHTGERPYTCGYCNKGFTQSQALTIHIRTHTGERPYMCELCGSDFRDSSSLRKHEFIRHPNVNPNFMGAPMPRPVIITHDDDDEGQLEFIQLGY